MGKYGLPFKVLHIACGCGGGNMEKKRTLRTLQNSQSTRHISAASFLRTTIYIPQDLLVFAMYILTLPHQNKVYLHAIFSIKYHNTIGSFNCFYI